MIHPIDQLKLIQPEKKDDSAAQLISVGVLFAGLYLLLRKPEQAVGESIIESGNPRAPIARKLISDEDKQAVKELYEDGYTFEDIAEALGVSGTVISAVLRETQAEIRPNKKPRVIPSDKVDEVVELYLQGLDVYEVAEKFGVSPKAVQFRLLEQNVQIRSQERFDVDDEEIKALYDEGLSIRQVAAKLNMSDTAVGSRLRRMGAVIRTPPKLSDEEIVKLYRQGLTLRQIADKFDVNAGTILSHLEKMGVARRTQLENESLGLGRKKQHVSNEEIKKLYLEGLSLKEIAEKFDVHISTIVDRLTKMGVERRAYTKRKSKAGNPRAPIARKIISDEDKQAVKELYEDGYTIEAIAEALGVSSGVIGSVLRETETEIRPTNSPHSIPNDKVDEVVELYEQGLTISEIAKKFGVSMTPVQKRLLERNIQIRSQEKDLSVEKIKALYLQGLTLDQIAEKFNVADRTISSRLDDAGVTKRTASEVHIQKDLPDEEIKNLYIEGLSPRKISDKYGVNVKTILNRLKKMGVARRTIAEAVGKNLPDEEIKKLYIEGLTTEQIAEKFDVSSRTILNRLEKMGVARRTKAEAQAINLPDEEIKNLYVEGLTTEQIAEKFDVSSGTILNRLEKMGVKRRSGGSKKS